MKFVRGDLLQAFEKGEVDIIMHQVNCMGVMGAGIAKQIKEQYPEHFEDYTKFVDDCSGPGHHMLGHYVVSQCNPGFDIKSIVGVFGQNKYYPNKRQTKYAALITGISNALANIAAPMDRVGIPLIGCGLAGGDWEVVEMLLLEVEVMHDIEFHVYQL